VVFCPITPCSLVGGYVSGEDHASIIKVGVWHKELAQLYEQIARKVIMVGDNEIQPGPGGDE
jgi:hypothetical protein